MNWQSFIEINEVPRRYQDATPIDNPIMPDHLASMCLEWIQKPEQGLILSGDVGTGKTYFMYCLARGLVHMYGLGCLRFLSSKKLDDRILHDLNNYSNAGNFLRQLREVPILFIDDFGIERKTERIERDYYEIFDFRYADQKPTVLSTNLLADDLEALYGARIFSRLKDCVWITFDGEDLRG